MANVGGDPSSMSGGAATLHTAGTAIEQARTGVSSAGRSVSGAVGDATLVGAVDRFTAAWSTLLGDTGLQIVTAAQLASNAAADLTTAGGGPH